MSDKPQIVALADLNVDEEGDFFALLSGKESLKTRDGKPYYRLTFQDDQREAAMYVWADSAFYSDAESWEGGSFFKIRGVFKETNYGPQIDARRVRAVIDKDRADGFDPLLLQARSRFDPQESFDRLVDMAKDNIADEPLTALVVDLLESHRDTLLALPAAKRNHHACVGGYLEHVASVTHTCCFLADKYAEHFSDAQPPLDKDIVVAGAVLHDIGKLRELEVRPTGGEYTASGQLIGHILQGRDMVREVAANYDIAPEKLLRLEHIIVAHQKLAEWGSPKPPMIPEALIVHHADDLDAKLYMMFDILKSDTNEGPLTSNRNALRQVLYRGGE